MEPRPVSSNVFDGIVPLFWCFELLANARKWKLPVLMGYIGTGPDLRVLPCCMSLFPRPYTMIYTTGSKKLTGLRFSNTAKFGTQLLVILKRGPKIDKANVTQ